MSTKYFVHMRGLKRLKVVGEVAVGCSSRYSKLRTSRSVTCYTVGLWAYIYFNKTVHLQESVVNIALP